MRRVILAVLLAVLAALVGVRLAAERPAVETAAMDEYWSPEEYNVLELSMPEAPQTAGSTLLTELDGYYFSRRPTAKGDYTGLLAGKNLVLLLAENWRPEQADEERTPALWRLRTEGVRFPDAYAPDWYQGQDGRQFALLAGMVPTTLEDTAAMVWTGEQGTYLPFSLGVCLSGTGYDCRAWPAGEGNEASYRVLGFTPQSRPGSDADTLRQALSGLSASGPFAAFFVLTGSDAEQTMALLWQTLADTGLEHDTLLCLAAGGGEAPRGSLTLWSEGLDAAAVSGPCSELDVTATLLDLLGAPYDSRFLSGRDLLAPDSGGAPVALGGSAYADWVTDAGYYSAGEGRFTPADGYASGEQQTARYVLQMRQTVYEQYVYARQTIQCNYLQSRIGQ